MKLLKTVTNLAIATAAIVSISFAQASIITTTSDSVAAGSPATINLDWDDEGAGNYRSVSADLQFDDAVLTSFNLDDCPAVGYTTSDGYIAANCTDQTGGVIRTGWALVSGGVPTGRLGTIVFQTDPNATPGDYDISFLSVTVDQAAPTEVVGTVTILPPPQPDYSSSPTPAQGVALNVIQNDTDPFQNVLISNVGEATSTLTGSCSETADPDGVFTISGDTAFSVVAGDPADVVTVTCDSAGSIANHTGEMTCTHNGNASPAVYVLSCNITAGPQAAYSDSLSPDPLNLAAAEQGDANPTGTITVTNSGDATTTLTGTCSYSGDGAMSLANGGFSLAQDASNVATLTCDATTEGSFSGLVSCTHNAGNVASPVTHDASCTVGPPGPAVYSSNPAPGATIDMTPPGNDVLVGSVDPTSDLQITNNAAELNDRDLALSNCAFAGSIEITATSVLSPLAPSSSTIVTFTCDTAAAGAFTGTYSCSYDEDGDGAVDGTATYPVNCGVRDPESDVTVSPASGTTLTITVPVGGSGQTSVRFSEILDEGADGTLEGCSLDDNTYHSIVSSTTYPQDILSGGFVNVVVEGTNPGDPSLESSATLTCTYSDSDSDGTQVSWPIDIVVQAESIPTLSIGGLLAMILTLLGLGGIVIRRRLHS